MAFVRQYISPLLAMPMAGMLALFLSGCSGIKMPSETISRQHFETVSNLYVARESKLGVETLTTNSTVEDYIAVVIMNNPSIEAAYYDWAASVEKITVERSLPNPRFTYKMDIQSIVTSIMPGLMTDIPGKGKLKERAAVASGESERLYYIFETTVMQNVFNLKKVLTQIHFLDEKIRITESSLKLLNDVLQATYKLNEAGKGGLEDIVRTQMEQAKLETELAGLKDSLLPLMAQLKAALGVMPGAKELPLPVWKDTPMMDTDPDKLLAMAFTNNPRIKQVEAEVTKAAASIRLAATSKNPDFSAGLEPDLMMAPVMFRPGATVTLPIWKDKIAAELAAAQNDKKAAQSRLDARQIALAVELAETGLMFRDAVRQFNAARDVLIPKARQVLDVTQFNYQSGKGSYLDVINAWRSLLSYEVMKLDGNKHMEFGLAEFSLLIASLPLPHAPFLPGKVNDLNSQPSAPAANAK